MGTQVASPGTVCWAVEAFFFAGALDYDGNARRAAHMHMKGTTLEDNPFAGAEWSIGDEVSVIGVVGHDAVIAGLFRNHHLKMALL